MLEGLNIRIIKEIPEINIEKAGQCGIIIINKKNNTVLVSIGAIGLLGITTDMTYQFEELFQKSDKEDKENLLLLIENLLAKGKKFRTDLKIIYDSGEYKEIGYIQIRGEELNDDNQIKQTGLFISDSTETVKKINELQRKVNKAEEGDRMKSNFLSNISHELRTPMNAILGFSELINIGELSDDKRREYSCIIKRKGEYLITLLDDIIELSKYESGTLSIKKKECNIWETMEELFNIFDERRMKAGKAHVELKLIHPKEKIGIINTDPGRLQQVLSNLLSNALMLTDKGSIEFGVIVHHDKELQFYVKDTGAGLSKDEQKYLFHRYRNIEEISSKKSGEAGLKLTISKAIIELLGGKIWVDSAPNEGSTFYFTIPLVKSEITEEELLQKEVKKTYNWKDFVILVVEDEEDNYIFIEAVLHDTQVQLIHATNGNQAVELCKTINKIDLVLMDIKMPEKSGYDATREIVKMRPGLPIIAQTAFAMNEYKDKCLEAGCVDYITKPFDVDVFIEMINNHLPA